MQIIFSRITRILYNFILSQITQITQILCYFILSRITRISQILCNLSTHRIFAFYSLTDYPDYTDFIEAMLDTVRFRGRPFWPSAVDGQAAQRGCRGGLYGRQRTTDKQHNIAPLGGKGKWTMGWSLWSPQTTA